MHEMKDSGVEFIGEIPTDWKILKVKYLGEYHNGLTYTPNDLCDKDEGILVLRSSNIKDGKLAFDDNIYVSCPVKEDLKVCDGDILICSRNGSRDLVGKNALVNGISATFGAFMMIYRCKHPQYMYYILNSPVFSYYLGTFFTSTINQLTGANFGNMLIPYCPNKEQQQQIAAYLDTKCAEIDLLVSDIQQQIETLEQYKRSIITEAVTKGLNPDVEMKDSGIKWIGHIPFNWNLVRIGNLYGLRNEKVSDRDFLPLSVTKIGIIPQLETAAKTNAHDERKLVKKGDFAINSRSDRRGSCGISNYDGSVSLINTVLFPIKKMNPQYYNWLFHTTEFSDEFYCWGHGIVNDLWTTRWQDMKNIIIACPPITEQKKIANYLDRKCFEIDSIIETKKHQLETLTEYKKSLIYEYVTGKKEVV